MLNSCSEAKNCGFLKCSSNTNADKEMYWQQGKRAKNIVSPRFSLKLLSLEIIIIMPTLH